MRTLRTLLIFSALLISLSCCNDSDKLLQSQSFAIRKACLKCATSSDQMTWLDAKIQEGKEKPEMSGNVYAITTSEGVVIVHQLFIMSCLGCNRFDCHGNTFTPSADVIMNEIIPGMNAANLIYKPGLN